ncbi:MAG: hypothetical protein QOD06_1941 [Candidatus Binatota bacterium]|nr:hypothetical protein [Candidatus Binatota bacterium]
MNGLGCDYAAVDDDSFVARYRARCHCGGVCYEVGVDPVDAKICHCRSCQTLHGAPMQWAAIFHKRDVRMTRGVEHLRFYSGVLRRAVREPPCKVSCVLCGTPIADEGRRMWLAFPTLFEFSAKGEIPEAFRPTCHIFYGQRVADVDDGLPKWSGHKNASEQIGG